MTSPRLAVRNALLKVLRQPATIASLEPAELDLFLRIAGPARLLSRVEARLDPGTLARLPTSAQGRLQASRVYCERVQTVSRFEVGRLEWVLGDLAGRVLLLKGCAYLYSGHPLARGRWFADVDLLAARDDIPAVEASLKAAGWEPTKVSDYDEAYYRKWMHELPPMRHPDRLVEADLHHTISPLSGRLKVDGGQLMAGRRRVTTTRFDVLSPEDMVVHAAVHLFQDGELWDALHQLHDLHELLNALDPGAPSEADATFKRLTTRAQSLGAGRPLYFAVRYAMRYLGTPVPAAAVAALAVHAPVGWAVALMDALVDRSLFPQYPGPLPLSVRAARLALYVRSHWLRMPPLMLGRHLAYKAWLRITGRVQVADDPYELPI